MIHIIQSEFKADGTVYCRGEAAYTYKAGDKVSILYEMDEELVYIVVMEGNAIGLTMPTERSLLKL